MDHDDDHQHKRKADDDDSNSPPKQPRLGLSSLPPAPLSSPLPAMVLSADQGGHPTYLETLSAPPSNAVPAHHHHHHHHHATVPESFEHAHVVDHPSAGVQLAKISVIADSQSSQQFHHSMGLAEKKARKRREGLKRNRSASCRVSIPKEGFERLRCFACAKHKTCVVGAVFAGDDKYWTPWLEGEFALKKGFTEKGVIHSVKCGVSQAFHELHRRVEAFKWAVDHKREPLPVFESPDDLELAASVTLTTSITSGAYDTQPSPPPPQMKAHTPEPGEKLIFQQLPPVQIQTPLLAPVPLISGDPHVQHAFEQRIQIEIERNRQLQMAHMHLQARLSRYEDLFSQFDQLIHRFKQIQQQPHFG
eukprot:TRINITY_DN23024_c0_g1_i1.p1 TRINITY_DN23024_c0_g1~~TRINITY_DN23024_c0_g1_i1.p1  ORF type:complete len:404 (+),score=127.84 TRINITY_DN23024_c0_g1_i1:127-1212(+)